LAESPIAIELRPFTIGPTLGAVELSAYKYNVVLPVLNPVTVNVPPVLFLNVVIPLEYVPPVTLISVGKFKYVVADIVVAVKPPLISVLPLTCNLAIGFSVFIPIKPLVLPEPCTCKCDGPWLAVKPAYNLI